MTGPVTLDASPATLLRSLRGSVVGARIAYPDVLHLEVRNADGATWRFATQNAEFSSADPTLLLAESIDAAELDATSGELRLRLSRGEALVVTPIQGEESQGEADDPPSWELITPDGLVLEFGPGLRWQIASAEARPRANGGDARLRGRR